MEFRELSDDEWEPILINPFLPLRPARDRKPRSNERSLLNGILYVIATVVNGGICHPSTAPTRRLEDA